MFAVQVKDTCEGRDTKTYGQESLFIFKMFLNNSF